ncbi:MAG TPA: hypothetical protein VEX60_07950 [Pyrinomonadaceae bacterium]|nr:hypothetical protein [Pyrinomonadaceae bacterium]
MKIVLSLIVVIAFVSSAAGQTAKDVKSESYPSQEVAITPATFFGPFKINGEKPKGFENFDYFILGYKTDADAERDNRDALLPDEQGLVAVRGQVSTVKGSLLDFESVLLVETGTVTLQHKRGLPTRLVHAQPVTISFSTVEMKGVKYVFRGEYLDEPAEEKGAYTHLNGVLSKFKKGKLVAEEKVGFVRVAYDALSDAQFAAEVEQ